jgi:hypothetical protein
MIGFLPMIFHSSPTIAEKAVENTPKPTIVGM